MQIQQHGVRRSWARIIQCCHLKWLSSEPLTVTLWLPWLQWLYPSVEPVLWQSYVYKVCPKVQAASSTAPAGLRLQCCVANTLQESPCQTWGNTLLMWIVKFGIPQRSAVRYPGFSAKAGKCLNLHVFAPKYSFSAPFGWNLHRSPTNIKAGAGIAWLRLWRAECWIYLKLVIVSKQI